MENHPIPQDITGFQFKLIGNMTVRQFVYLAIGGIIAALFFFIIPVPKILAIIISVISLTIGAGIAFVPVDGRPMDTMIVNFIRAIFSPTRYMYEKQGGNISSTGFQVPVAPQASPENMQAQAQTISAPPPPQSTDSSSLQNAFMAPPTTQASITTPQIQNTQIPTMPPELHPAPAIEPQNSTQNAPIETFSPAENDAEKRLREIMAQKEALEKELEALKNQTPAQSTLPNQPSTPNMPPAQPAETIAVASPKLVQSSNAFESPNLIKGIIKDSRGNPLMNILVEITDEEKNPVRAFKTNQNGQFASATSLPNGKYKITFEDPKEEHKFDQLDIEASGAHIEPLQITSIDKREELRRELFT